MSAMKGYDLLKYAIFSLFTFFFVLSAVSFAEGPRLKAEELKAMLQKKEPVVLIDVRTPEEHREAHIPGSVLMPLDTLEGVKKLPEGGRHVIYCRSGIRSQKALKILSDKGFKGLIDLEGGIKAWMASGGEVVTGK